MKISITDQFLWDVYNNFLEPAKNIANIILIPRTPYRTVNQIFNEKNPVFEKYKNKLSSEKFSKLIYRLKKNNWIKAENLNGVNAIMLTKEGIDKAMRARFKQEDVEMAKRKDGKWVMVIFDIPQSHKKSRNLLRSILQNLGYKMFQHSVWITLYDVSKKTKELLQWYSLDGYVKIFLIEKI